MGLFRKKEKEYTFDQIMEILTKKGNEPYRVESTNSGKYLLKLDETVLKQVPDVETPFRAKREKMMSQIVVDEECRRRTDSISQKHGSRQEGKPIYNNYQATRDYQKKYGDYGR